MSSSLTEPQLFKLVICHLLRLSLPKRNFGTDLITLILKYIELSYNFFTFDLSNHQKKEIFHLSNNDCSIYSTKGWKTVPLKPNLSKIPSYFKQFEITFKKRANMGSGNVMLTIIEDSYKSYQTCPNGETGTVFDVYYSQLRTYQTTSKTYYNEATKKCDYFDGKNVSQVLAFGHHKNLFTWDSGSDDLQDEITLKINLSEKTVIFENLTTKHWLKLDEIKSIKDCRLAVAMGRETGFDITKQVGIIKV